MKESFYDAIKGDPSWQNRLHYFVENNHNIHLAIMVEPFLSAILDGRKTVESRFSRYKIAPYQKVRYDDLILLKQSSGPVIASFKVSSVNYFELTPEVLEMLQATYGSQIDGSKEFWRAQHTKQYATLLGIGDLQIHTTIKVRKQDPRGWVVI